MKSLSTSPKKLVSNTEELLQRRLEIHPELARISSALRNYREEFIGRVENIEKYMTHRFDPVNMDYRAGSRNQVLRSYYDLMMTLTREPTIFELTRHYNSTTGLNFSKWTIRRYVREINRSKPKGMTALRLSVDTPSKLYSRDVAACYQTFVHKGIIPSSRDMISELRKTHPESRVTWHVLKKHLKELRNLGLDVRLQFGELTPQIVKLAFTNLKKKTGEKPSAAQIVTYLRVNYAIHTSRHSVLKMLENIRKKSRGGQENQWVPNRSKQVYAYDLKAAYKIVQDNLKGRGIKRLPACSEIYAVLLSSRPGLQISQGSITERFTKMNGYPLNRIAYPNQDRVEETAISLAIALGRPPTIPEISETLLKAKDKFHSTEFVARIIRAVNKKRASADKIKCTIARTSGIYDYDFLESYNEFLMVNNRYPSRHEMLEKLLLDHPERQFTIVGFDYRVKILRREGHEIKFRGGNSSELQPKESSESIRLAASKIVRQELHNLYADTNPGWYAKNREVLFDAALRELIKNTSEVSIRKSIRNLMKTINNN